VDLVFLFKARVSRQCLVYVADSIVRTFGYNRLLLRCVAVSGCTMTNEDTRAKAYHSLQKRRFSPDMAADRKKQKKVEQDVAECIDSLQGGRHARDGPESTVILLIISHG
jgi:hypothetical protein